MRLVAFWVAALARARKLEFLMSDFMVAVAKRSWSSASLVCALFCSMFGPALIFFLWGSQGPGRCRSVYEGRRNTGNTTLGASADESDHRAVGLLIEPLCGEFRES